MTRRRLAALPLAALALAGCGGGGSGGADARKVLARTGDHVGQIRSGELSVELVVTPHGKADANPFGFRLKGPFAFGAKGAPPRAHIDYTQIANGKEGTATLVLGAHGGYALANGQRHALTSAQVSELQGAAQSVRTGAGTKLDVGKWIDTAKSTGCPSGVDRADCVKGDLDVVEAVNGLLAIEHGLRSARVAALPKEDAASLRSAVHSATYELAAGKSDHLLRRLTMHVDFAFGVPKSLRAALGELVGADVRFALAIDRPNEEVDVPTG